VRGNPPTVSRCYPAPPPFRQRSAPAKQGTAITVASFRAPPEQAAQRTNIPPTPSPMPPTANSPQKTPETIFLL
jgi:hypothetical protein